MLANPKVKLSVSRRAKKTLRARRREAQQHYETLEKLVRDSVANGDPGYSTYATDLIGETRYRFIQLNFAYETCLTEIELKVQELEEKLKSCS